MAVFITGNFTLSRSYTMLDSTYLKKVRSRLAGSGINFVIFNALRPVPDNNDPELVALLKQKDPAAIIFLYEKYAGAIYGLVNQVLAGTDVINETFVEAFAGIVHSIDQHDSSKSRLFTWMMQLARELAIEKLKSISPRRYPEAGVKEPGVKVERGLMSSLHRDELQVMTLAYLRGYSVEEMAGKLEISPDTVKQRINKALIAINSQVKK